MRRPPAARWLVLLAAVALLVEACSGGGGSPRAQVGEVAPTFSTRNLDGRRVRLADFRGRTVLLNFWASWCIPCRTEFPLLAQVHGDDVAVLGVVFRDSAERARAFMAQQRATWPGLVDPRGQIARAYGIGLKPGIPVTFAIDAGGRVVARHLGELRGMADVEALLARARPG